MPVPDENGNPYFDVVFGNAGDLTAVPDAVQPSGSISYNQGWGPFYSQDPTVNPATALFIDRAQTNQLFNDLTKAIQAYQQFGTPAFITTSMNGGSPFSYAQGARVVHGGVVYISIVSSNTDTPPSTKWSTNLGRTILTGNQTYYIATSGNDITGNGTSGTPWATLQHAINYIIDNVDCAGFTVTISIADGTYSAGGSVQGQVVGQSGPLVIQGNNTTPDNVVLALSSGIGISAGSGAYLSVSGMKLTNSGAGAGLFAQQGRVDFQKVDFGTMSGGLQVYCQNAGFIQATGDYTVSGSAGSHYALAGPGGEINIANHTVTLTGTPAFSTSFANVNYQGLLYLPSATFSGAATGQRYAVNANGVIETNGGGASFIPGNSGGTATNGGIYT